MVLPLRKVIRVADDRDLLIVEENKQEALSAFDICQKKVIEHGLDMSWSMLNSRLIAIKSFFTSLLTAESTLESL